MKVMLMLFFIGLSATLRCQSDTIIWQNKNSLPGIGGIDRIAERDNSTQFSDDCESTGTQDKELRPASLSTDTIYWTELAPLPDTIQRIASGYFLIDSDFYVAGGQVGYGVSFNNNTNVVWQYHIPTNTWYQKNNFPFNPAACAGSFVLNNKGYFLCAQVNIGYCSHQFWAYDPMNDAWARMADYPDSPRQNSAYFAYAGKGYVGETGGCGLPDSHFWAYLPDSNTWNQVASLPSLTLAINSSVGANDPKAPYLLGGNDVSGNLYTNLWSYDTLTDVWNSLQPISNYGRSVPLLIGLDSILVAGGGFLVDSSWNGFMGNDFYKYTIATNTWSPVVFINSFDSAAWGNSFVFNKHGYYFGGANSIAAYTTSNRLWSFDASRYFPPNTATGVQQVAAQYQFKVYPNPLDTKNSLNVQTSEDGEITFYDLLGRITYQGRLKPGINTFDCSKLSCERNILLYKAKMQSGRTENGKMVTLK